MQDRKEVRSDLRERAGRPLYTCGFARSEMGTRWQV